MAIGVNWAEIWKPVWKSVWTTVPPVTAVAESPVPGLYVPGYIPNDAPSYIPRELNAIAQGQRGSHPYLLLDVRNVAPTKPRNGMVILADGTNWNPGSGAGVYARISGAWVKL